MPPVDGVGASGNGDQRFRYPAVGTQQAVEVFAVLSTDLALRQLVHGLPDAPLQVP